MGEIFGDAMLAMLPAEDQNKLAADPGLESSRQRLVDKLKERLDDGAAAATRELKSGFGTGLSHWRDAILHRSVVDVLDVAEQIILSSIHDDAERLSVSGGVLTMAVSVLESAIKGLETMYDRSANEEISFFIERAAPVEACLGTLLDVAERSLNLFRDAAAQSHGPVVGASSMVLDSSGPKPRDVVYLCEQLLLQWIDTTRRTVYLDDDDDYGEKDAVAICKSSTNVWLSTLTRHASSILVWFTRFTKFVTGNGISGMSSSSDRHTIRIALLPIRDLLVAASNELDTRGKESSTYPDWLSSLTTIVPPNCVIHFSDVKSTTKTLGVGSFGKVVASQWFGTQVAMKTFYFDGESQKALDNELRMMLSFRHPRIVAFIGVLMEPAADFSALPVLAMEFVAMGSLFDSLDDIRNLSTEKLKAKPAALTLRLWRKRLWVAYDVASALSYLHALGFVHRDLRSANVLIDSSVRGKLADFSTTHESGGACPLDFIPDPKYMPPEVLSYDPSEESDQCEGVPGSSISRALGTVTREGGVPNIESAADVFSFGVLLWEITTGSIPWEGLNWAFVTRAVANGRRLEFPKSANEEDNGEENADPNSLNVDVSDVGGTFPHLPDGISTKDIGSMAEIASACWKDDPKSRPPISEVLASLKSLMLKSNSQKR